MKDTVSMYIDTSGDNLYKRGYREKTVLAPMRETLAFAMVDMSFWRGDRPLADPFCGSGTLLLRSVQLEGKKRVSVRDFLLGYEVKEGTVFTDKKE